jgi:hypothetical protein
MPEARSNRRLESLHPERTFSPDSSVDYGCQA